MLEIIKNPDVQVLIVGVLLVVSEFLGTTSKFKSSSILQLVINGLKKLKGKQDEKKIEAPKAE